MSEFNVDNIQGNILVGIPKKVEQFIFLQITDVHRFRKDLAELVPHVTTTRQAQAHQDQIASNKTEARTQHGEANPLIPVLPIIGVTVGFSNFALTKLCKTGDWQDNGIFENGMKADVPKLGDPTNPHDPADPKWLPAWKEQVDVMIDIAGDSWPRIAMKWHEIENIFGIHTHKASAKVLLQIKGNVRPGKEKGHEHFGFMDGISNPTAAGFGPAPTDGLPAVDRNILILGDKVISAGAPAWARDGSFAAFRHLTQLAPEFNKFLEDNPIPITGLSRKEGSELLGARFFGRWKSGAPIDVTPLKDDPVLALDPTRNNHFDFTSDTTQARCPFSAHVRKTNPRTDLPPGVSDTHRIIRRGITYGPEVSHLEAHLHKTHHDRGLAFLCYQADIEQGFRFQQSLWANNTKFPPKGVEVGFDPIIGQNGNNAREVNGTNPQAQSNELNLPFEFVVTRGGEYFFIPSISALKNELASD